MSKSYPRPRQGQCLPNTPAEQCCSYRTGSLSRRARGCRYRPSVGGAARAARSRSHRDYPCRVWGRAGHQGHAAQAPSQPGISAHQERYCYDDHPADTRAREHPDHEPVHTDHRTRQSGRARISRLVSNAGFEVLRAGIVVLSLVVSIRKLTISLKNTGNIFCYPNAHKMGMKCSVTAGPMILSLYSRLVSRLFHMVTKALKHIRLICKPISTPTEQRMVRPMYLNNNT